MELGAGDAISLSNSYVTAHYKHSLTNTFMSGGGYSKCGNVYMTMSCFISGYMIENHVICIKCFSHDPSFLWVSWVSIYDRGAVLDKCPSEIFSLYNFV